MQYTKARDGANKRFTYSRHDTLREAQGVYEQIEALRQTQEKERLGKLNHKKRSLGAVDDTRLRKVQKLA